MYPSNRVRTANPVSVRFRVMVSASLSSAAVESPVLIESLRARKAHRAALISVSIAITTTEVASPRTRG